MDPNLLELRHALIEKGALSLPASECFENDQVDAEMGRIVDYSLHLRARDRLEQVRIAYSFGAVESGVVRDDVGVEIVGCARDGGSDDGGGGHRLCSRRSGRRDSASRDGFADDEGAEFAVGLVVIDSYAGKGLVDFGVLCERPRLAGVKRPGAVIASRGAQPGELADVGVQHGFAYCSVAIDADLEFACDDACHSVEISLCVGNVRGDEITVERKVDRAPSGLSDRMGLVYC